jgi:hypothetical protein
MICPDSVNVVFSDGKAEKAETFLLTKTNNGYAAEISHYLKDIKLEGKWWFYYCLV